MLQLSYMLQIKKRLDGIALVSIMSHYPSKSSIESKWMTARSRI